MLRNQTIHEVFAAAATRTPQGIALVIGDRQMTYAELAHRSDNIAQDLLARGVRPNQPIGLLTLRSMEFVCAILGILKAGAVYVPFDLSYPVKLLRFIYEDCAPVLMLVQDCLLSRSAEHFWGTGEIEITSDFGLVDPGIRRELPRVGPDAAAYIMYSSGSTGQPKGVLVAHRGVVRLVIDNTFVELGPEQVHLHLAPLPFDASTFEIWSALLNGAKLVILPDPVPSLDDIAVAIARDGVTTVLLTSGLFNLMIDHRIEGLKPLRQLITGGEILSPRHATKALRELPHVALINAYGPTENTTITCCYRVPHETNDLAAIPIGKPIAGTEIYILDESQRRVTQGQDGELYTGGAGIALGYLNRPNLNAERFLTNIFDPRSSSLLYRTGDRVRERADGNVEFLGRADRQVKINGQRVELDEIEACLRRSPLVEDAAVVCFQRASRKIYAYVKLTMPGGPLDGVREFLKRELPIWMLPAGIFALESLPLYATGKLDRSGLPPPTEAESAEVEPKPATCYEEIVLTIWRDALDMLEVGVDDNLFDLGATSLQWMKVHARIQELVQTEITVNDLFQYSRISELADWLSRARAGTANRGANTLGK
jgi:amino acid adenylation domain-containing protein